MIPVTATQPRRALRARRRRRRPTSTRRRSASRSSNRSPVVRGVPPRASASDNHHDLGLFSVGPDAPRPEQGRVGLYHLAWEVPHDRRPRRRARAPRGDRRARRRERPRREQVALRARPRRQRVRGDLERAARGMGRLREQRGRRSRSTSTPEVARYGTSTPLGKLRGMPETSWSALASDAHRPRCTSPRRRSRSRSPMRRPRASRRSTSPCPSALPDGRTGRVPAGCVFWMKAAERTFSTVAEDHGNCSVGSVTHGFKTLDEVAGNSDVAALLDIGLGHDGRRPPDPGGAREARRGHLRTARRDAGRPRRRVPARQRPAAHGAVGRDPRACASKASRSATSSRSPRRRACPPRAWAARSAGCAPACRPPR